MPFAGTVDPVTLMPVVLTTAPPLGEMVMPMVPSDPVDDKITLFNVAELEALSQFTALATLLMPKDAWLFDEIPTLLTPIRKSPLEGGVLEVGIKVAAVADELAFTVVKAPVVGVVAPIAVLRPPVLNVPIRPPLHVTPIWFAPMR